MKLKSGLLTIGICSILFASCTNDINLPDDKKSEKLVLTVSVPDDVSTRADGNYKLRYIAQLFEGASLNTWGNLPPVRQEIIDGDTNQIIFTAIDNTEYTIFVFADYIPKETATDASGHFADYFYNTTKNNLQVSIRITPGSDDKKLNSSFFNNENYDCFFAAIQFKKEEYEKKIDLNLKRIASKVIFKDTGSSTGQASITVNQIAERDAFNFDLTGGSTTVIAYSDFEGQKYTTELSNRNIDSSSRDLFFFYTLAEKDQQTIDITFTTQLGSASKQTTVNNIPVRSNYQTIVSGTFLPAQSGQSDSSQGGDSGSSDTQKVGNNIILNISTDLSWEQQSISPTN